MKRNPAPSLVDEIDALKEKLEARLCEIVAEEKMLAPSIPEEVHKSLLLRNSTNLFDSMRRLLIERGDTQKREAQQDLPMGAGR